MRWIIKKTDKAIAPCVQNSILRFSGVVSKKPCIPDGGSPSWFYDYPRVTDAIFTGPNIDYYRYCSMTSQKSMSDSSRIRRRVDYLSPESSSKEILTTPHLFFYSVIPPHLNAPIFHSLTSRSRSICYA